MGRVRVAVAGVGNCCSALVQGVHLYKVGEESIGLMHEKVGGYTVSDIEFVLAFDIDERKVGKNLSKAIFAEPNNVPILTRPSNQGITVSMGHVLDSVGRFTEGLMSVSDEKEADVREELRDAKADVLVNLISGGADEASKFYADAAIEAGCSFLNATPTTIAGDEAFLERFRSAGLPMVGDDLLDQVGATVVHMGLLEFLHSRGVKIDESFQLDVGGGTESLNTLERTREKKRSIKTTAVSKSIPYGFPLISGSTDYVDFLENSRDSYFWMKGRYFGGASFTMDVRLGTIDAPNGGAVLLDVIRAIKLAIDRGLYGAVLPLCAYGFKSPPKSYGLQEAYRLFSGFIMP